ncbi:MAG: TlpA disulfide reductase family protein [Deltaproteobacteria bacterium]
MTRLRSLRRTALLLFAIPGLVALSAPRAGLSEEEIPALRPLVQEGESAPSFTLKGLDGKPRSFAPGKGSPALLVFWSAFCPLCRELTPELVSLAKRHRDSIRFLSVNLDGHRFRNAVRAFVKEFDVPDPVLLDEIRNDLFVASDPYGVSKTPTAVLVDAEGLVLGAYAAEQVRTVLRDFDQLKRRFRRKSTIARPAARPDSFHDR